MVLVSVLMASYGHEKYLPEAIDSVLNQSFRDFELIIIDDCSKDNSKRIIETCQKKDPRVRALFHKKNMGIAKTVNDLLAEATGKYVAYIDSDDVWVESKLEKQLAILKNDDSVIVWSEGEIIDNEGVPTGKTFTQTALASSKKKNGRIFEEPLDGNFIFGSSLIHKREYTKDIQYDEQLKYLSDYRLMVNLAKNHQFYFTETPLAKYRTHGKNTILSDEKSWTQDYLVLYNYFLRKFRNELSKRTQALLFFRIGWYHFLLKQNRLAVSFFLKALKSNATMYILVSALTNKRSNIGNFLLNSVKTILHSAH